MSKNDILPRVALLSFISVLHMVPIYNVYTVRVTHTLGWYKLLPTRPG
jgi:hypothetical protein